MDVKKVIYKFTFVSYFLIVKQSTLNHFFGTFFLFFLTYSSGFAQRDSTKNIQNVDVITIYKPNVAEAVKIEMQPVLEEPKYQTPTFNYNFPKLSYQPNAVYSPIGAVLLKPEKPQPQTDNYLKIGGGNYGSALVDARYFSTRDKKIGYGVSLGHHSANYTNNPELGYFNTNTLKTFAERRKKSLLRADVNFDRNVIHYYGFDTLGDLKRNDIKQGYNHVHTLVSISEIKKGNFEIGFHGGVNIFSRSNANEILGLIGNTSKIGIPNNGEVVVKSEVAFNPINQGTGTTNRTFVLVNPGYEFSYNKLDFILGLNANFIGDEVTSKLEVAPNVKLSTFIVPERISIYAGVTGGVMRNTMQELTTQNFFLSDSFVTKPSVETYRVFGGMTGKLKNTLQYGIRLSHRAVKNFAFFVNDTSQTRNFVTIYDDLGIFNFGGDVKISVSEKFNLGFEGNTFVYNLNTQKNAWHLPSYDLRLSGNLKVSEKIYANITLHSLSGRQAKNLRNEVFDLAAINDVNLGMEYRYKKNISGFFQLNNIINKKYEIWNHHFSQGINGLLGVTISL